MKSFEANKHVLSVHLSLPEAIFWPRGEMVGQNWEKSEIHNFSIIGCNSSKNVRFGSIIPFWKPQAIYFLVLSQKMAKNGQKYPPDGAQVGNPKIDPPQQILKISMVIGFFLVFSP